VTLISPSRLFRRDRDPGPALAPVLLITPPSLFLLDERVFLSLGILKVGAVLERAGIAVEHLDLSGISNYLDALTAHLAKTSARAVAITTTTPQLPAAALIAKRVRDMRPDLRLIVGGPHATLVHAAYKLEAKRGRTGRAHTALSRLTELFDVVVSGDGEAAIFEALAHAAPALIDADEPANGMFMSNADYDESPWPARHLVDVSSYHYEIEGKRATSAIAQLGCPYQCGFCGGRNTKMLRKIRMRTTANIVAEIEHLHREHGFTGFMLYDDELNVNREMVGLMNAIADLQARLGVEFRLRGFVKSELLTDEQAAAMKRAGFRWILCGFEAAHPRILANIRKQATREDNTRVLEIGARHGLKVKALMSVGHPGESEDTILAVCDWLLEVKPADFDCTVISTFPGTPYYDEADPHPELKDVWTYVAKKSGDRLHAYDVDYSTTADYYKGAPGQYASYVFTDHLAAEEIVKLRDQVEREVRAKLCIPFNPGAPAQRFEHSMGQGANELPGFMLRRSAASSV
jgi:anaerobic magnesium-protoporphyrin IX monomethyl ester cyclase